MGTRVFFFALYAFWTAGIVRGERNSGEPINGGDPTGDVWGEPAASNTIRCFATGLNVPRTGTLEGDTPMDMDNGTRLELGRLGLARTGTRSGDACGDGCGDGCGSANSWGAALTATRNFCFGGAFNTSASGGMTAPPSCVLWGGSSDIAILSSGTFFKTSFAPSRPCNST